MSKQIKRIPGTIKHPVLDDLPDLILMNFKFGAGEAAINHAFYRAKQQNKPFRAYEADRGMFRVTTATEDLPANSDFYDVYQDGSIYIRG